MTGSSVCLAAERLSRRDISRMGLACLVGIYLEVCIFASPSIVASDADFRRFAIQLRERHFRSDVHMLIDL